MASDLANLLRQAQRAGWQVRHTGSNHLRLDHPEASRPVFGPLTPRGPRSVRRVEAALRRSLREAGHAG